MPFQVEPITQNTHQTFSLSLGEELVSVYLWWNVSDSNWYIALYADDGVVMGMRRLTWEQWLLPSRVRFGGGDLRVEGLGDPDTLDAFEQANKLVWYTGLEIEQLEAQA